MNWVECGECGVKEGNWRTVDPGGEELGEGRGEDDGADRGFLAEFVEDFT